MRVTARGAEMKYPVISYSGNPRMDIQVSAEQEENISINL